MWGTILAAVLISGSIYGVIGFGFALARRLSGVFNLAHGGLLVLAAYCNYALLQRAALSPWISISLAMGSAVFVSVSIEAITIPSLRRLSFSDVELLVASWLLLIVIENSTALGFSNASIYLGPRSQTPIFHLGSFRMTLLQVVTAGLAATTSGILYCLFRFTHFGKSVSAIGDDPRLALIMGLDVKRVRLVISVVSGVLTGGAGVLLSYQERIDPHLGMRFSIIAIIAALVGQPIGPAGALFGGLALASCEALVLYLIDPGLRNGVVYGLLVLLIFKLLPSRSGSPAFRQGSAQ